MHQEEEGGEIKKKRKKEGASLSQAWNVLGA